MLVRQPPTFWWRSLRSGACRWSSDFLEIRTRTLWTHYAGAKTRSDSSWFVMKKALLLWPAVTQSLLVSWASAAARRAQEQCTCSMGFMTQSSMGPRFWQSPARRLGPYWVPDLLKGWIRLACTTTCNLLLKLDHRCRTPRRQNPGVPNLDTTFSAITESLPMITQFNRRKTMRLRSTFPR